ncbi:MAG: extracellular solute-binding protein, partial [Propionibacteriaceae bacterium]
MKRREAFRLGAGVAAAATMAACTTGQSSTSASGASGGQRTEIVFSYLWSGAQTYVLDSIIGDFNLSQNAITVKGVSNPDTTAQLTNLSSPNGTFDISDNFSSNTTPWASKGILTPLDDYMTKNNIEGSAFIPEAMQTLSFDGKIYQLPIAVQTFKLLYNKKLLADAGVTPPTTMAEFAAANAKLTKYDAQGNLTQVGYAVRDPGDEVFELGFASGGSFEDANGPTPTNQKLVDGLTFYQDNFVNKVGADKLTKCQAGWGSYASAQDPFFTGKVAMVLDGEYMSYHIGLKAPKDFAWGVGNLPVADGVPTDTSYLLVSTLFIPSNAKHKDEAAVFLKYLTGEPAMQKFTVGINNLPARISLSKSTAYDKL